ncbi:putative disease resistance protein RGA3 [Vicia villosa]|uniref:putative disease resistance protein RGA3 n=1 Tax=Vicia villosa TaxID=3911 RepID=UPI00273BF97B|nr:putative disease resistance protein RGA3 [Vicia villosa]
MNMFLSESSTNQNNIGVLAIVGMGGVEKTKLAQLAHNDENVHKHFDLTSRACVSEDFDVLRVTKAFLESVTKTPWETDNIELLRVELKKNLRDKRFFFVLDDLWNDKYSDWDELVSLLISGKTGSSVIITTCHRKVVDDVLPTFGRLRVLSLSRYRNITTLPETIGNLLQLRYLNLTDTEITRLSDTICNLYYLQTLILSCCSKLT